MQEQDIAGGEAPAQEQPEEGKHAARARKGRKKPAAPDVFDEQAALREQERAAAAGEQDDDEPGEDRRAAMSPLDIARRKLDRMLETNRICFRHKDDFGRIEHELRKFNYTDGEMDMILEPKGSKGIPGFSFQQLERQKMYVHRLESRTPHAGDGYAAGEERRDQERDETQLG